MDFVTRSGFDLLESKIEELRKDKNFDIDCIQERLSIVAEYHIKLINALVEENKQLKKEIENLNKKVNMMWNQIDRLERKDL